MAADSFAPYELMHWSTRRALDTIAREGHARLDQELLDVLAEAEARVKARRQNWKVCSSPQCPVLVNDAHPCPQHGRPVNAHWSSDRDRNAQRKFREQVLARDGNACTRCHRNDVPLVAHHLKPGYDVSAGVALCESCHRDVDASAR